MIKLWTILLVCYTLWIVLYVVCYQTVTRNSNNVSGYAYNSLHQLTLPPKIQILNLTVSVIKHILVSINSVTFNLDACKVSFLNYFLILKKGSLMWSMFEIIQKFAPAPPTGFYRRVVPLNCWYCLKPITSTTCSSETSLNWRRVLTSK